MKRKNKLRYIKQINRMLSYCNGWPLYLIIADRHRKYEAEHKFYLQCKKYSMSKKGRADGCYYISNGKHPSRLSHGKKHGSFKPEEYEDYLV